MTQEEKIKDLEERIALMDANNSALCTDLEHWKKVAAGLKGHNGKLVKKLNHYEELLREADELNENRIAAIDEKNKTIEGLQSQVRELALKKIELEQKAKTKECLIRELETTLDELEKPWWKRIF